VTGAAAVAKALGGRKVGHGWTTCGGDSEVLVRCTAPRSRRVGEEKSHHHFTRSVRTDFDDQNRDVEKRGGEAFAIRQSAELAGSTLVQAHQP
jgi:hypothetical protein